MEKSDVIEAEKTYICFRISENEKEQMQTAKKENSRMTKYVECMGPTEEVD